MVRRLSALTMHADRSSGVGMVIADASASSGGVHAARLGDSAHAMAEDQV